MYPFDTVFSINVIDAYEGNSAQLQNFLAHPSGNHQTEDTSRLCKKSLISAESDLGLTRNVSTLASNNSRARTAAKQFGYDVYIEGVNRGATTEAGRWRSDFTKKWFRKRKLRFLLVVSSG
jgi:hypothetical protein